MSDTPAKPDVAKPIEKATINEKLVKEKQEKLEKEHIKEKPEAKEHKDKLEKEHKEAKEHKEHKEKLEKEHKEAKEHKEHKDKLEKEHHKEIEKIHPDKLVVEKSHLPEKQINEIQGKELAEGEVPGSPVVDPATALHPQTLLAHAASIEAAGAQLRHFIEQSQRPDLSTGALKAEPDQQTDEG